ncbi:MAG TPA: FAD-binding and (Fe-S)-binding domain-containing protein [Isosphaeraceae bacterium]|nr:FAD-binding and (Fe-S)-binding domain-containing protein [Isosphaeraceae bacterium]
MTMAIATATTIEQRHRKEVAGPLFVNASAIAAELRGAIRGEVRFDAGSRALYATDGSNYRQVPIGVVIPRDIDDVVQTIAVCRRHGAPILSRGGGTSLTGGCCNVAVVIDWSKHVNKVLAIDPVQKLARVQPGTVLDVLRSRAEEHHLTFAPDPSTHNHNTLGGMIGNNSCGVHSLMGLGTGRTSDQVHELEILLYDGTRLTVGATSEEELERIIRAGGRRGQIYTQLKALRDRYADEIRRRYPKNLPRRVSGYNLDDLLPEKGFHVARALAGTEGTCVTILEATLHLVPSPAVKSLLVLGYPDVYSAGDHIAEILESQPTGLEGLDDILVADMKKKGIHPKDITLLPEGGGWLLVEFGGESKQESDEKAHRLMDRLKRAKQAPSMKLFDNEAEEEHLWKVRESGLGATARIPGEKDAWEGWEDSAVPPDKVGPYLRDLRKLFQKYDYNCSLYGHFGQGCIHTRIDFELKTYAGIQHFRRFLDEAGDLVVSYGGSISGEHGDGQSKAALLPKMFGEDLVRAFGEFKAIWDPDNKMNPHKVVEPYLPGENLRLGPAYHPPQVETHFKYLDDKGSFAYATERCVGIGECRKEQNGTMCPSYMVTKEEMHSTRGRTHLLFEMLQGDPMTGGWRNDTVREALDLCLACKGCRTECPMNVDMATYKAEFLAHYYQGRLRPRHAYAMGLISWWARVASLAPGLVNLVTHLPVVGKVLQAIGGISTRRTMPWFAPETFVAWFRRRRPRNAGRPRVLLWPDTFNNHFHPQTAKAAVEVLEAAGFEVIIPPRPLCCGRPLYDFGMLETAKGLIRQVLDVLRPEIAAGTPVVGLEPSCVAVFRDEMTNLFPMDEDAKRLSANTFILSEFLEQKARDFRMPRLRRKALVQKHCHHEHVMTFHPENAVLQKLGLDYELLDSGCCGMAGSFGFEAGHYDVSVAVGERRLLPAVRQADPDTLIIADGFSCREQIAGLTDRGALHLAQVIQMAMHEGPEGPQPALPERAYQPLGQWEPAPTPATVAAVVGLGLLAGLGVAWALTRSRDSGLSGSRPRLPS